MRFLPLFVGWLIAAWWARWLAARGAGELYGQIVTWTGAGALVLAQAMATVAIAVSGPTSAEQLNLALTISQGVVILLLISDLAMTIRWMTRPKEPTP